MKFLCVVFYLLITLNHIVAQTETVAIWHEEMPNRTPSNEIELVKDEDIKKVYLVQTPTLQVFLPSKRSANGKAMIVCPGGGYAGLAYDWEGADVAKRLNSMGVAAFVLKYRLPNSKALKTPHEVPLQDAQRAMRWVRFNAEKFNIDSNKIGVIGFSAGGHLASTLGTQFNTPNTFKEQPLDTISARPDFMVLVYPVITMKDDYTHKGSQNNLLGKDASDTLKLKYSNENHVTKKTPPTFLVHSTDDKAVPVENSLNFYKALKNNNIPVEMHIYPYGGHGYALANGKGYLESWMDRLQDWLMCLE